MMKRLRTIGCAVAIPTLVLASTCSLARAAITKSIGIDEVVSLKLSQDTADDSQIVLWNQSGAPGTVSIEELAQNPTGGTQGGFLLLDGTMRVTTDLQAGQYRALLVREYDPLRVRAGRLRARSLRVLRLRPTRIWRIARPLSGELPRVALRAAPLRELRGMTPGLLGKSGYFPDDSYVWSVVDNTSDFAVGGVQMQIPEPSALLIWCLVGGGGTLVLVRRSGRLRKT